MQKITMKDVAREAGVSVATVSYVLNNTKKYKISEETREKVLKVTHELGFVPNSAAKTLKLQEVKCVGLVILKRLSRNLSDRHYKRMMVTIKENLSAHGYQLLICSGDPDQNGYPDYIMYYLEKRIGAIIYIAEPCCEIPYEERCMIEKNHIPTVVVDSNQNYPEFGNLKLDYQFATHCLLDTIFREKTYERILCLLPADDFQKDRNIEYQNAVAEFAFEHKIPYLNCKVQRIGECDRMEQTSFEKGVERWLSVYNQVDQYIDRWQENDLIFCANALIAENILTITQKRGINADIALGEEFMNIPTQWMEYLKKGGIFYVSNMHAHTIGMKASEMLIDRLEKGENQNTELHGRIVDFSTAKQIYLKQKM